MAFTGKAVIVTGASSGIGRAAAIAFAREGAHVVLVSRNESELEDVRGTLTASGATSVVVPADITEAGSPDRIVQASVEAFGGIDVLVNAAGVIATGTLESTTDEAWDQMMGINLRAPFRLMRA
jgi:NAD(P)-dependent dehydrogenase (short-subunit alcohol dehydrogenase family)